MAVTSVHILKLISNCLLPLWEALQHQQVGLTQAPLKLLLLPRVPEHVSSYMCPSRVDSLFPPALQLS